MTPRVRFAPAPSGPLHIGGARTALFNWLFARATGGEFHLRIEDTAGGEHERDIVEALDWLLLDRDGPVVRQSANRERHVEVARSLASAYRDDGATRLRTPEGMDDFVLLRSDEAPTFMLACAVDDHDSGVTHVIRGDDHESNTKRQRALYDALGWKPPEFVHLPLVHGPDGAKMSKRDGAPGILEWRDRGILPNAMTNALLRLGWGKGEHRLMSRSEMVGAFKLEEVGRSAARFDPQKLWSLNRARIRSLPDDGLASMVARLLPGDPCHGLRILMPELKSRADTIEGLAEKARFLVKPPEERTETPRNLVSVLEQTEWSHAKLERALRGYTANVGLKLVEVAQPLRLALTGYTASPPLFLVMEALGRDECLRRLR